MQQVNVASIAAKYKSKYEIHLFLTVDCAKYLPSLDCVTIYWMKDLINGVKKAVDGL